MNEASDTTRHLPALARNSEPIYSIAGIEAQPTAGAWSVGDV